MKTCNSKTQLRIEEKSRGNRIELLNPSEPILKSVKASLNSWIIREFTPPWMEVKANSEMRREKVCRGRREKRKKRENISVEIQVL